MTQCKGAFYLGMVIVIWVGSAWLIQLIFSSSDTDFNKPLFLTYFSTSFFTIYLIPLAVQAVKLFCFDSQPLPPEDVTSDIRGSAEDIEGYMLNQQTRELSELPNVEVSPWDQFKA